MKKTNFLILILIAFITGSILSFFFYNMGSYYPLPGKEKTAQKIICMAPNITEIVFALGQADKVVGVTNFCNYPPEARKKSKVGGYINPNFERLIALAPDLIILQGRHEKVANFCKEKNISFINMQIEDIKGIFECIQELGKLLDCNKKASDLIQTIKKGLNEVKNKVTGTKAPSIFFCLGRKPGYLTGLYTTGKGSFLSELLIIAGCKNIFKDAAISYPQVSKESLIKRSPEVIIETYPGETLSEKRKRLLIKDWQHMPTLPAVKNKRIYFLTDDFLLIPGPRVHLAAGRIAEILHPERFHE